MRSQIQISVIIPTYNRRALLASVLPSVLNQTFPADQREVVIIVDGSTDGIADYVRTIDSPCELVIVEQMNRGPAAARNAGARVARGDLLLFLDDDIRCPPDLLSRHVAAHNEVDKMVVFGPVLIAAESRASLATDYIAAGCKQRAERLAREGGARSKYDVWVHSNCSLRRETFLAQGGYDEEFLWAAHEDQELAIRLSEAGVGFHCVPDLIVRMVYDKPPEQVIGFDSSCLGLSEVMLCRKHPGFRAHSGLARINRHVLLRAFAYITYHSPVSLEPLFRPAFHTVSVLRRVPVMRRLGIRILSTRMRMREIDAVVKYLGSWDAFRREFSLPQESAAGEAHEAVSTAASAATRVSCRQ